MGQSRRWAPQGWEKTPSCGLMALEMQECPALGAAVVLLVVCAAQHAVSPGAWLCPHADLPLSAPAPVLVGAAVPGRRSGAWSQRALQKTRALQPRGVKAHLLWKQGGYRLSCQPRARYVLYMQSSLCAPNSCPPPCALCWVSAVVGRLGGDGVGGEAPRPWARDSSLTLWVAPGVFPNVCPLCAHRQELHYTGFSTLFYYKDRLFQESATSTTQQVRALHPQHVPKFKNMLQRAWGFKATLETLKLLLR